MTTGSHLLRTLARLPWRWKLRAAMTALTLVAAVVASVAVADRIGLSRPPGDPFLDLCVPLLDDETEVVVLGSSHVFCNVRTTLLDRPAMSLSLPNAKLRHLRELVEHAVAECPNLRLVMVELSAVNVLPRASRVEEFEAEKRRQLDTALGIPPDGFVAPLIQSLRRQPGLIAIAERDTLNPEWLRARVDRESGGRILEPGFHGWSPDRQQLVGEGEHAEVHAAMLGGDIAEAAAELRRIAKLLEDRGVALRLIRTPHFPSYAAHQSDAMAAAPADTLDASGLPRSHWWDSFMAEFPREQWFDEDHLDANGAAAYTRQLKTRIDELLD